MVEEISLGVEGCVVKLVCGEVGAGASSVLLDCFVLVAACAGFSQDSGFWAFTFVSSFSRKDLTNEFLSGKILAESD